MEDPSISLSRAALSLKRAYEEKWARGNSRGITRDQPEISHEPDGSEISKGALGGAFKGIEGAAGVGRIYLKASEGS
jgi:hypothetical protein